MFKQDHPLNTHTREEQVKMHTKAYEGQGGITSKSVHMDVVLHFKELTGDISGDQNHFAE